MRNLAFLVGGKSVSGVLGLVYLTLAVRALGVEAYGQLALIYAFALTVSTVVKFQTWQPILHYGTPALQEGRVADFHRLVRFTVGLDVASSVAGAALAVGGIWLVGPRIGLPEAILPQASAFGASLLFMVTATPNGLLRLFDRFDLLLVEDNVEAVIRLAGSLLLFLIGGGLTGFLAVWALSVVGSGTVCAALAWRELRRRVARVPAADLKASSLTMGFPGMWGFVWSTNINSSLKLLRGHFATLIVGALLGTAEAGLFRVARQIAEALAKPVKLLTPVVYPELARFVADRRFGALQALNRRTLQVSCIGAGASFLLLAVAGRGLLGVVGGGETAVAYTAMLLLSAAALIRIAVFVLEPTLISLGHPALALGVQGVAAAVYVPLLIVSVRVFGIEGAGGAAVLASLVVAVLQHLAVSRRVRSRIAAENYGQGVET
ncbi:lipopolysaccharide biosynthesis protein [Oleispirillum naphthae]|uniref:lipopolysaccharide biosynthesis protein n=1 Tax=Oleispirillum naphthae TaxID=2838853 RepID=UPI003082625A